MKRFSKMRPASFYMDMTMKSAFIGIPEMLPFDGDPRHPHHRPEPDLQRIAWDRRNGTHNNKRVRVMQPQQAVYDGKRRLPGLLEEPSPIMLALFRGIGKFLKHVPDAQRAKMDEITSLCEFPRGQAEPGNTRMELLLALRRRCTEHAHKLVMDENFVRPRDAWLLLVWFGIGLRVTALEGNSDAVQREMDAITGAVIGKLSMEFRTGILEAAKDAAYLLARCDGQELYSWCEHTYGLVSSRLRRETQNVG